MELVVKDLSIGYSTPLVSGLNFRLNAPTLAQIIGPNGVGKTTLFKTVLGLIKPLSGRVLINGGDVTGAPAVAGRYVGYVPQLAPNYISSFPMTLWEFLRYSVDLVGGGQSYSVDEVVKALRLVNIPEEMWYRDIRKLSGGQRQKALIARALLRGAAILLLDEPLSNLDLVSRSQVADVLLKLSKEKLVLVSMHDPTVFLNSTDSIILLGYGKHFVGSPRDVMKFELLKDVYGESVTLVERCQHILDLH
ncbi:MAG: metal ABC transporter ATP-binding protein [Sulfolobales archaeon]|nr:metal ABC transporter ATP-binding protein [Sulfolobales archaeon]MCX8185780.1 metal ABC transporter ATP-binding protein [Sulfolobales archaeon]MDW7970124.1 metal ABC transporter ATP-binding protein [Sulfolobales archaeon]